MRYVESVLAGRDTLWCCLCCGGPFTYPDEAYSIPNNRVQGLTDTSRVVRLALADPSLPHTQWNRRPARLFDAPVGGTAAQQGGASGAQAASSGQNNPLVGFISWIFGLSMGAGGAASDDAASLVAKITRIAKEGGRGPQNATKIVPMSYDTQKDRADAFKNLEVGMCEGCAALAGECARAVSGLGLWKDIPPPQDGPAWNERFFCAVSCAHISLLAASRHRSLGLGGGDVGGGVDVRGEHRSWRAECLTRLHLGCLVYHMSREIGGASLDFPQWYVSVFHPVLDWEKEAVYGGARPLAAASFSLGVEEEAKLAAADGASGNYAVEQGDPIASLSPEAISNVIRRVGDFCEAYPYSWEQHAWRLGEAHPHPSWAAYYALARTVELARAFDSEGGQWAPLCVLHGLPGDLLLSRLRATTRGKFASQRPSIRVFRAYMEDEALASASSRSTRPPGALDAIYVP